jgi:predicted DNA-binding antitoxin AbrB/MazE fold protein
MSNVIHATFVDGVFKPDGNVSLPPQTRVELLVRPLQEPRSPEELDALWKEFDKLCEEHPIYSTEPYLTRDQLHERR